jgi:hypothetical protein
MRRGFTHSGGLRREKRWVAAMQVCTYCDATVNLRYESDAVNIGERALDLYRALRNQDWAAVIEHPGSIVKPICPTCKAVDHE